MKYLHEVSGRKDNYKTMLIQGDRTQLSNRLERALAFDCCRIPDLLRYAAGALLPLMIVWRSSSRQRCHTDKEEGMAEP
jgi:hypothetical protein